VLGVIGSNHEAWPLFSERVERAFGFSPHAFLDT
jgi:hypothetical protein